jgi:hypothetical protein
MYQNLQSRIEDIILDMCRWFNRKLTSDQLNMFVEKLEDLVTEEKTFFNACESIKDSEIRFPTIKAIRQYYYEEENKKYINQNVIYFKNKPVFKYIDNEDKEHLAIDIGLGNMEFLKYENNELIHEGYFN